MSHGRKVRRNKLKARGQQGQPNQLKAAMADLSQKMQAMQGVEHIPALLHDLEGAVIKAEALAEALADDYNTLLARIERLEDKTGFPYTEEPQEGS